MVTSLDAERKALGVHIRRGGSETPRRRKTALAQISSESVHLA